MILWNIDKSKYFDTLKTLKIKIVPTEILKNVNISKIIQKIEQKAEKGIVLKPLIGSRAYKIIRIRKYKNLYEIFIPYRSTSEKKTWTENKKVDLKTLKIFLNQYVTENENALIMQNYIVSDEYCAIFLDNKLSHIIQKKGKEKDSIHNFCIHHKNFDGTNVVIENPSQEIVDFTEKIFNQLPKWIKNENFNKYERIDILQEKITGELFLLEIEAVVPDLFLQETNNINKYICVLKNILL